MLLLKTLMLSLFLCVNAQAEVGVKSMSEELTWYSGNCLTANVAFYKKASDKTPYSNVEIKETAVINQITSLLNKIPVTGPMMIKMGPDASCFKLTLNCDNKSSYDIKFYNDKIKTPSTGFLVESHPDEKALIELLKKREVNFYLLFKNAFRSVRSLFYGNK